VEEGDMGRVKLLGIPVLVVLVLGLTIGVRSAAAQNKTAKGTIKSVTADSLTVTDAGKDMTFAVDKDTKVQAKGAGTSTKAAGGSISITSLLAAGDKVQVTYGGTGTAMHAMSVRVTQKAPPK
jgi:hypothetical protein